jgi:biotin carboxylase
MLWILGRTFSGLEDYLEKRALPFGYFHDSRYPLPETNATQIVNIDFTSKASIQNSLQNHNLEVTGILLAGYEQYVQGLATLNELFSLSGLDKDAALAATDKTVMRATLQQHNRHLAPVWAPVHSMDGVRAFADKHTFPLVLKPNNLMKSLYVSICKNMDELTAAFAAMQAALAHKNTTVLIEEFLDGSMHTLAGFVDADGAIAISNTITDCVTAKDNGVSDSYIAERIMPSYLSSHDADSVRKAAHEGVKALGLKGVALHIEIMLTSDGPKIIEIGARLGGYRRRMYQLSQGVDLYEGLVNAAIGLPFTFTDIEQNHVCVIELFAKRDGTLVGIQNVDAIRDLPAYRQLVQKYDIGSHVGRAQDGKRAVAFVILAHKDRAEIDRARKYINMSVDVTVS